MNCHICGSREQMPCPWWGVLSIRPVIIFLSLFRSTQATPHVPGHTCLAQGRAQRGTSQLPRDSRKGKGSSET